METKECREKIQDESATEPRKSDSPSKSRKRTTKTGKSVKCSLCCKTLCSRQSLSLHLRTHTGEKLLMDVTSVDRGLHLRRL